MFLFVPQLYNKYHNISISPMLSITISLSRVEVVSFTNMVVIDVLYTIPESDRFASHRLFIDAKGKSNIVQVEVK